MRIIHALTPIATTQPHWHLALKTTTANPALSECWGHGDGSEEDKDRASAQRTPLAVVSRCVETINTTSMQSRPATAGYRFTHTHQCGINWNLAGWWWIGLLHKNNPIQCFLKPETDWPETIRLMNRLDKHNPIQRAWSHELTRQLQPDTVCLKSRIDRWTD